MKNKKIVTFALLTVALSGCGEKDAQYYYDNPKDLKVAIEACSAKVKAAQTDADLDKLATDSVCKEVQLAKAGINAGDLKRAILAEERVGWAAKIKIAKKDLARRKEHEAKEKVDKVEADKLRETASKQPWKDYLNNKEHNVYLRSGSGCKGGTKGVLCTTLKELWAQKAQEGKDELTALPYDKLKSKEKEYCKNAMSGGSLGSIINACSVWKNADNTRYQMEFDAYLKGDEAKIRKDYNSCRANIEKHKAYTSEWLKATTTYPCVIVSRAAARRFDQFNLSNFKGALPK